MTEDHVEVKVELRNQKLKFHGSSENNPEIILDHSPPLGDGQGYTPLELCLMSLAACSGATVISLLRKFKADVTVFSVKAKGDLRQEHPKYFKEVSLHFTVTSSNVKDEDVQKAIRMSEERFCPVWAMLKATVTIKSDFEIIR